MPNVNQNPNLLIKNKSTSLHMYIHKHPCESKPKLTNMQSLSSILQGCIQLKKIQVEFISSPKYINKDANWPIDSKKNHGTTNNNISKSF